MNKSWVKKPDSFEDMFSFLRAGDFAKADGNIPEAGGNIPEAIERALMTWALLYDVPFQYLVAREEALPEESIRFFYVDYTWLFALLDGAMSVGRFFDVDYQHDAEVIEGVIGRAMSGRFAIRPRLQGKPETQCRAVQSPRGSDTGFLLRSAMVRGFRGLEFKAYDRAGEILRALRLETLDAEILLGIYDGEIAKLEIAQPPEGLHFGFTHKPSGGYEKRMRDIENGHLYEDEEHMADVVMRETGSRVVDLAGTAVNIAKALTLDRVTPAHVALEMIQNPLTGIIERKK